MNGTSLAKRSRPGEQVIYALLVFSATISILTTIGIVYSLLKDAISFFGQVSILDFLTGTEWSPGLGKFGVLPLLSSTLLISFISLVIALPMGLAVAIYLSEYAKPRTREFLKPVLELLAGVPTIVYGYFALTTISPLLRSVFGDAVEFQNMAASGIAMAILIVPLISSMCEDALSAVPRGIKEAAYAMGATKLEVSLKVIIPAAFSGIAAAFIIGLSRAIGETMIVAVAAGSSPNLSINPLEHGQTITGYIAMMKVGDRPQTGADYEAIFALGLLLFVVTLALNILSRKIVNRFREVYE